MRRLIADLYKIVFKITRSKAVSFFFALGYITWLNLLTIYGLVVLLEDLLPGFSFIARIFSFPYYFAPGLILLALNFWLMLPLHKLSQEVKVKPVIMPIIIYTIISAIIYAYTFLIRHGI